MSDHWAFRCKNCGRLETSDHAAELALPAACSVCGAGVAFSHAELAARLKESLLDEGAPVGDALAIAAEIAKCDPATKRLVPENWEVLADAAPERLAELGLTPEQVEAHEPWPRGRVPERHRGRHFGGPAQAPQPGATPRAVAAAAGEGAGLEDRAG